MQAGGPPEKVMYRLLKVDPDDIQALAREGLALRIGVPLVQSRQPLLSFSD